MTVLRDLISVSDNEKPYVHFESSLDDDQVVSGYVPVKSTLDVLSFLKDATATHASQGRAVICHGSYGSGKSRLCAVLARLFRDGFESPALQPIWERLKARGATERLETLRRTMVPGGGSWRPWLVVSVYEAGQGETISNCLINAIFRAVRRAGLDDSVLGTTIHRVASVRLSDMVGNGASYTPPVGSPYATVEQLKRALEEDSAEDALNAFRDFYRTATFGTEFDDWARSSGGVSLEAHEVFSVVSERIQSHGYDGIVVIWDEFGFFIEELLRASDQGNRSLSREAMSLQNFLERACASSQLGRKVVFLGFTHVSIAEYGSRQGLGDSDKDRLSTVADRFRDPSIPIQLSVTENEGYHLLAGMIHRTDQGRRVFANPLPKLQQLATRMVSHSLWQHLGNDESCYNEIVAPCYPLHPATSSALMLLSDQVAQRARTTFYFLQNRENGGMAAQLEQRTVPDLSSIGSRELIRISDLFSFFKEAIRETKRSLLDQYEEAVARFPNANDLEIQILQTVLVLSVIATPSMAPTTAFLSMSLCDSTEHDLAAKSLHAALKRLSDASSLWKNEATNVWSFVGSQGLTTGLDDDLAQEKSLIPTKKGAAELMRESSDLQRELIDLIGDFDLDPAASGIVRRIGINVLPVYESSLERVVANHPVNTARESSEDVWRSARVFLLATDSELELAEWRQSISQITAPNYYFVIPRNPLGIDRELVRDLIAAKNLLEKTAPGTHAYEVLEGRLTRLRTELKAKFDKSFGNEALGTGSTIIVRGGSSEITLPIASWNELLPAITDDLDESFNAQIRVRCGTFNEWKRGQSFSAIEKIAKRILRFDDTPEWQTQFLNFGVNSQEAAIIDGVLVENNLFKEDPLTQVWSFTPIDTEIKIEALLETLRFFQKGSTGDKEISKLFMRLINPPFGIPNGIIPLLIALVARSEGSRIVFYQGPQGQRVLDSQLSNAIADMARHPTFYRARYNKLSNKQRIVFCAIGPEVGVNFPDKVLRGEAFYEQAELVRTKLRDWISNLPEVAVQSKTLAESQRHLTRILRQPVPPQLSILADTLIDFFSEDNDSLEELNNADSKTIKFEAMSKHWGHYRLAIERYVDGVRAPVNKILRELSGPDVDKDGQAIAKITAAIGEAGSQLGETSIFKKTFDCLVAEGKPDSTIEEMIGVITGKRPENLTEEDYGKAAGILEVASDIKKSNDNRRERQSIEIVEPSGKRTEYTLVEHKEAISWVMQKLCELADLFSLSSESAKAIAVGAICRATVLSNTVNVQTDEHHLGRQLFVEAIDQGTGIESTQDFPVDQSE
jgi:hypothetical protein